MASLTKVKTSKGNGYRINFYDTNGNRTTKTVYCSRSEAERLAHEIEYKKSMIRSGVTKSINTKIGLIQAIRKYNEYGKFHKADSTLIREAKVFKPFLAYIEDKRLDQISKNDIMEYLFYRGQNNVRPASIGIEIRTLKAFFNYFQKLDYIAKNPVKGIKQPRYEMKIRFLSKEEIDRLITVIDSQDYKDLVLAYIHTGARRKEILAPQFTWKDVDFTNKRIKLKTKGNKTRYVPINKTLMEILCRRKDMKLQYPFEVSYYYSFRKIKKYYAKANIENANIHTLRKTFGSLLIQKGVSIFAVSKLMDHSSVTVTQKHYATILESQLADDIAKLDDL